MTLRQRPGDQPLPVHNDSASMHDLVIEDLEQRFALGWTEQLSGAHRHLEARKQLGLSRYGTILQVNNGRDALRDLFEELADGSVYCKQAMLETNKPERFVVLRAIYYDLLRALLEVQGLIEP